MPTSAAAFVAWKGIANIASSRTTDTTAIVVTGGADSVLVLYAQVMSDGADNMTATYDGVSMTKISYQKRGTSVRGWMFYLINPNAGTKNVVTSWTTAGIYSANTEEYSGVATSSLIVQTGTSSGTGTLTIAEGNLHLGQHLGYTTGNVVVSGCTIGSGGWGRSVRSSTIPGTAGSHSMVTSLASSEAWVAMSAELAFNNRATASVIGNTSSNNISAHSKRMTVSAVENSGNSSADTHNKFASSVLVTALGSYLSSEGRNGALVYLNGLDGVAESTTFTSLHGASASVVNMGLSSSSVPVGKHGSGGALGSNLSIRESVTYIAYHNLTYKRISWFISKLDANGNEVPVTGLTPVVKLFRDSDAKSLDFTGGTFETSATFTANPTTMSITATMTERDATYYPGYYDYLLETNGLGAGANTLYIAHGKATDTSVTPNKDYYAEDGMVFKDGILQWGGMTFDQHTQLMGLPTVMQQRAGTRDELTAELARIDSTISSRATPADVTNVPSATAVEIATAVLAAATTTPISANVKKMNDASVTGTGVAGDLWRG
jgi:hypothetical protein